MSQTKRAAVLPFPPPSAPPAPAMPMQFDSDVLDVDDELDPVLLDGVHSLELYREQVRLTEQLALDEAIAFSFQEAALQKLLHQEEDIDMEDSEAFELVPLPSELEEKPVPKCSSCLEPVQDQGKQRVLPCKHMYCLMCITTRCRMGLRDRSLVPAHCCKKEFPVDYVKEALSHHEMSTYERYLKEKRWQSLDLLSDKEYASVVANSGGKQCPGCGIGVQRISGCNHMRCSNSHEFCFECGKVWKTCPCNYPGRILSLSRASISRPATAREPFCGSKDGFNVTDACVRYGSHLKRADPDDEVEWEVLSNEAFDEVVARMILKPDTPISNALIRREGDGTTLLHVFAGFENCKAILEYLLEQGIPVDTPDNDGSSALIEAAQEGQIANFEVLMDKSNRRNLSKGDTTPLLAAIKVGNEEMTKYLLNKEHTWSERWDNDLFKLLLEKTPGAAIDFLDHFAVVLKHSNCGKAAVKYKDLRFIYGDPNVPVDQTALACAVEMTTGRDVLPHRVMKHIMKVKWKSFAKSMFRREFTIYCSLLLSYYVPTIWADPNWVQLASGFDYWVFISRIVSWACSVYLLLEVEYKEFLGNGACNYLSSFWNWLNLITYVSTVVMIPFEFIASLAVVRNCLLALITVTMWINILQFLQVSTQSGLLLSMMARMVKDVYHFVLLYAVFLLGFSGAFYTLLRGSTGYEDFTNSFITVALMLYGQLNYDTFSATTGWTWHMSNGLLVIYLMSVVIVLLNILIAMMATTYSDIFDAAEAATLHCHAQAVLRMEKALSDRRRLQLYNELLGITEDAAAKPVDDEAVSVEIDLTRRSSTQRFFSKFEARQTMFKDIAAKMKNMPSMDDAKQKMDQTLGSSPTWAAVQPMMAEQLASFRAADMDKIKEKLYLKTAFDVDDFESSQEGKPLGLLDDGIRQESASRAKDTDVTHAMLTELQNQVQQLTALVKDSKESSRTQSGTIPRRRASILRYASPPASDDYV